MMKKLVALALLGILSLTAFAQTATHSYKFEDSLFDFGGRIGISYNNVSNVPDGMSRSGLGLDFCIMDLQYRVAPNSILSLGVLDLQIDFRYLQKGNVFYASYYNPQQPNTSLVYGYLDVFSDINFGNIPFILKALEDSRAKARLSDFTFSFPLGFTQKFGSRWAASLFVAPGVGLISYRNDYISGEVHHKDKFYPTKNRAGFRLDLKAVVWFEDMGLQLRYQPVGFTLPNSENKNRTFSVGLVFNY